jgi:hypothetical protein
VDRDRDVSLRAEPLGEADVVAVAVGQDQGAHVLDRSAQRRELLRQVPVQAGDPRVDEGDLVRLLDQIGIDDAVISDAVDARCDLYIDLPRPWARPRGSVPPSIGSPPRNGERSLRQFSKVEGVEREVQRRWSSEDSGASGT